VSADRKDPLLLTVIRMSLDTGIVVLSFCVFVDGASLCNGEGAPILLGLLHEHRVRSYSVLSFVGMIPTLAGVANLNS
jgi:hypothetical protein